MNEAWLTQALRLIDAYKTAPGSQIEATADAMIAHLRRAVLAPELSGETMAQREEVCAAWADLPAELTAHPGLKRLYLALGGIKPRAATPE